jgi:hypothetical protein
MAWAAPSLVCILSTYTSLSRSLCVCLGAGNVALVRLHRMKKKVNTFSYLRFLIRFFFFCFLIVTANDCQACEEADTYENIMDNYCRADFGESLGSF